MHAAMIALQTALVTALEADSALTALIGAEGVFDAPPQGREAPYIVIARHDAVNRDSLVAPGTDHRLTFHVWAGRASRAAALEIADRLSAVALAASLDGPQIAVTHRVHDRTETLVDLETGQARAAVRLRFFSEPAT